METPKEQAIKAAYGEYWEQLNSLSRERALTCNGWLNYDDIGNSSGTLLDCIDMERDIDYYRPKSLSGIETNNSWTRIESEEDLPKHNQQVFFVTEDEGIMIGVFNDNATPKFSNSFDYYLDEVTHYQPIEVPKPPIF